MCNGIEKIKCTVMKCHTNVNSTPFTQLPHKFSYIVAILGHNHFESPNMSISLFISYSWLQKKKREMKFDLMTVLLFLQ
jgi:hypothetical protein